MSHKETGASGLSSDDEANQALLKVIDNINSGSIARGRSAKDIDALLGTKFENAFENSHSDGGWRTVDFEAPVHNGNDSLAAARRGWYLAIRFSSTGLVEEYYLSNLHK